MLGGSNCNSTQFCLAIVFVFSLSSAPLLRATKHVRKPNFFIVGAPKCGTTSLATWLGQHPQVYMSPEKEPHHFYSPYGPVMPEAAYNALFMRAQPEHLAIGEASTWYLFSREAIPRILAYQPEARIVVCLRNPVEMAVSLHNQKLFSGHELVESFSQAWALNDVRMAGKRVGVFGIPGGDVRHLAYGHACSIGSQLESVMKCCPRHQLHIIVLDDLKADPRTTWLELLRFLELQDDRRKSFPVHNSATRHRSQVVNRLLTRASGLRKRLGIPASIGVGSRLSALNSFGGSASSASLDLREELFASFRGEISVLEDLLHRNFDAWSRVGRDA